MSFSSLCRTINAFVKTIVFAYCSLLAAAGIVLAVHAAWNVSASLEPLGSSPNRPRRAGEPISICIYATGLRPAITLGAGYSRLVAQNLEFTDSVNVANVEDATAYLSEKRRYAIAHGESIETIAVQDHSGPASPCLNRHPLNFQFYAEVARCARECGTKRLLFLGCSVAKTAEGRLFAQQCANETGVEVVAASQEVQGFEVLAKILFTSETRITLPIFESGAHIHFAPKAEILSSRPR